jgi:uracil-DNA glycosylase family 4
MIAQGTNPEVIKRIALATSYTSLQNNVRNCQLCGLHKNSSPVSSQGSSSPILAIILPPPSPMASQQGLSIVGRERDFLEESLAERAGISWGKVRLIPSLGCRPDSRLVPISESERACRPNVLAQLAHGSPESVLVLGSMALRPIRPNTQFGAACSKGWLEPCPGFGLNGKANYISYFVTIEPKQALDNKGLRKIWESDLDFLGRISKWKLAELAYEFFSNNKEAYPEIIGERISDLNPYLQEKHTRLFGSIVEEIKKGKK